MTDFSSAKYFLLQRRETNDSYVTLAGLSTKALVFTAQPRPKLGFSKRRWQKLAPASGPLSVAATGVGLFANAGENLFLAQIFASGGQADLRLKLPSLGHFTGPFMITELAYEGQEEELIRWRVELHSAADVDFEMA